MFWTPACAGVTKKVSFYRANKNDDIVRSHKSPFDKLRANGGHVDIIDFIPFVVSLSNHKKTFYEVVKNDDLGKKLTKRRERQGISLNAIPGFAKE